MTQEQIYQRRLSREKRARAEAERLLEQKSRDLYEANQALAQSAKNLELQVAERTQELEHALERLHSASRAKDDFLATISHEIRTPLNALLGAVGLLKDSSLDRTQRHYLELGEHAGRVLLEQINHILDYVRLQDVTLEPELETQTTANLMDQVVYAVAAKAQAKGLRIFGSMDPESDVEVIVDSAKARQVVLNFLDNAIKFTPSGWVWFHASAKPLNKEYVEIRCEVIDTGFGLPDDPDRLFLPFERSDHSTDGTRAIEGTGLGLSISKKIVDGFEGSIGAQPSPYGAGSRFWCASEVLISHGYESSLPRPGDFPGIHIFVLNRKVNAPWLKHVLDQWQISYEMIDNLPQAKVESAVERFQSVYILEIGRSEQSQAKWCQDVVHVTYCASEREADELDSGSIPLVAMTSTELLQALACGFRRQPRSSEELDWEQGEGRVLLVEDSHANQVITSAMLMRKGYIVDTASNGQEAVDAAACLPYDLILMDIQMPVMDGLEAAAIIQSSESSHAIPPILALTASVSDQIRRQCDQIGIREIVPKPVVPETLFRAVRKWCDERPERRISDSNDQTVPWVSHATVSELARNAPPKLLRQLLAVFIEEAEQRIEACQNGIARCDLGIVVKQAHALKSAAGTYGATHLGALAEALERGAQEGKDGQAQRIVDEIDHAWQVTQPALHAAYRDAFVELEQE